MSKHQIGSVTVEAIDTYVRVTINNVGCIGAKPVIRCTKRECPTTLEVVQLLSEMRGYWPDNAHIFACSLASRDAMRNKEESELRL